MQVKLLERGSQPEQKREIPISKEEFLIGRGADCDLRLQASAVSRHHCLVRVRGAEVAIIDLGSSNGTYLNGVRVRSQAPLGHGDELKIGTVSFTVALDSQEGIDWGAEPNADPSAVTMRLPDVRKAVQTGRKEGGHLPGEAGGPGGAAG
jgi:pSer/pThr/pTyr-binding forkhead associated (FHA) protein